MGEIDEVHHPPDQGQSHGHGSVKGSDHYPVDEDLKIEQVSLSLRSWNFKLEDAEGGRLAPDAAPP